MLRRPDTHRETRDDGCRTLPYRAETRSPRPNPLDVRLPLARGGRGQIEHEVVTKIEAAKVDGGYLHCSDHSVPPTVSWDDYRFWQELAREHADT